MMLEAYPFIGVVESLDDPLQASRVQVRLYGYHTENKALLPTDVLRWFNSGVSNSASVTGIGKSGLGYKPGSTVYGNCFDPDMQNGIILCSFHGIINEQPSTETGFSDPNGILPIADRIGESDTNRLARNDKISQTVVQQKIDDQYVDIPKGDKTAYSEPENEYAAIYPNNEVLETLGGHIIEFDDTENSRRIHVYHASGTFFEIFDDGKIVVKSKSDVYELSAGSKNIYSKNDINVSSDTNVNIYSGQNTNVHIKGDAVVDIEGNCTSTIGKNCTSTIKGSSTSVVEGNVQITNKSKMTVVVVDDTNKEFQSNLNIVVKGNATQVIEGNSDISVSGNASIKVDGDVSEVVGGSVSKTISGDCSIIASGVLTLDGSIINIG